MRPLLRQLSPWAVLVLIAALPASAQEPTTLTGSVLTPAGAPVAAATIYVESMNLGVLSNAQGRYVLIVPAARRTGGSVEISASQLGYARHVQTIVLQAGTQTLNFVLGEDPLRIEGITVTALGMERQARTLGISTQQLSSTELTRAESNFVNTLSGRIAGVHINNSGPQGGSSRIVIRGENSLTGRNDPLFIIDGVPVDNSTGGRSGTLTDQGGFDYGNAIQDIDPDAIASVTVLKGPNAAALYGSRASNGAVIITTKTGEGTVGGAEIVVSQQVTFEDELRLPDYQNQFGGGYYGEYGYFDGDGNGLNDQADESWGPPLDANLMIPQWFSAFDASRPGCDYTTTAQTTASRLACRVPEPWVSRPNNVDQFFDLGVTSTTNVSVAGSTEGLHGRAAVSYMDLDGMQPGHQQKRTSFSVAGGIDAFERLDISSSVQYISSDGDNRPGVGYGSDNIMGGFVWFNRQVDTRQLKDLYESRRPITEPTVGGFPYNWTTHYWINPFFKALSHQNTDERNRLIGQVSATYELTPWLSAMVRTGTDWYSDQRLKGYAANPAVGIAGDYTTNPIDSGREQISAGGSFGIWDIDFQETNTDFLLSANPSLGLPFTTSFTFGGNRRDYERRDDYTWVGELSSPGIFDVSNAATTPERDQLVARKRVNSLYGQADFGFNDYLFLTFTGRNDWSSTLPVDNRSYFYPSVSSSFVFSDFFSALDGSPLSYGKLRASWARVGNDTDPYRLRNTFAAGDLWGSTPSFTVPGRVENPNLKPEVTESWEFGTELGFLDNRLGLDVTYYREQTRDQLMPVQLTAATGFASQMRNAGTVENKGWEVLLRGTPIAASGFRWESTLTWAKNDSKVVELAPGVTGLELSLGDFWGATLFAREGEPFGQLVGSAFRREDLDGDGECGPRDAGSTLDDPNGRIVVYGASGGDYEGAPRRCEAQVIGNVNPDWRAGWSNEFSYRGVRLGVLFDMREGGHIYSVTNAFGRLSGVLAETVAGRCDGGYPACDATTGIVFNGVQGTPGNYVPNTSVITAEDFWINNYLIEEANLEPAGYIKLREVTLSYGLPTTWANRFGAESFDVSVVGRNLALWTDARHIDPETALEGSNIQGFEYGQMPSVRSFGLNITVRP